MKEIKKLLKLNNTEYYETHLSIINCLLPQTMTPMELKVMARFMALEGDIAQYRFGPSAKKIVMTQLNISPAGLSNYLTSLSQKGFLFKQGDIVQILPILMPEKEEQFYLLKLQNAGN
jgi:hypothetical protein